MITTRAPTIQACITPGGPTFFPVCTRGLGHGCQRTARRRWGHQGKTLSMAKNAEPTLVVVSIRCRSPR